MEFLERRRLLSAVLEQGVLNVGGTNGDDEISLAWGRGDRVVVNINGEEFDFAAWDIDRVVVNANAGDDRVVLGPDPDMAVDLFVRYDLPTLVLGGRGQDSIYGGSGNDTLDGGTGVNELDGRGGDDLLRASDDADDIRGGAGTDTVDYSDRAGGIRVTLDDIADDGTPASVVPVPGEIWERLRPSEQDNVHSDVENVLGSAGDDEITGNRFNNVLSGGGGDDMLFGGFGRDILNGNWGNDRLLGNDGSNTLVGRGGDDVLEGGEGIDYLRGGDGNDILYGHDKSPDTLDGGRGHDPAAADEKDVLIDAFVGILQTQSEPGA